MKIKYPILFAAALATGLLVGCAGAPEQQIEEAYAALTTADSLEADLYAPELYKAAQDSFAAAQADIEGQEGVAGVKPDYTHARALLAYATETAQQAVTELPARKEAVRVETDSLIADAQARLAAAQQAIAAKPPTPGSVSVVSLEENSGSAQAALQQAVEAQANGAYAQAKELVREALLAIEAVEAEVAVSETTTPAPRS